MAARTATTMVLIVPPVLPQVCCALNKIQTSYENTHLGRNGRMSYEKRQQKIPTQGGDRTSENFKDRHTIPLNPHCVFPGKKFPGDYTVITTLTKKSDKIFHFLLAHSHSCYDPLVQHSIATVGKKF